MAARISGPHGEVSPLVRKGLKRPRFPTPGFRQAIAMKRAERSHSDRKVTRASRRRP